MKKLSEISPEWLQRMIVLLRLENRKLEADRQPRIVKSSDGDEVKN